MLQNKTILKSLSDEDAALKLATLHTETVIWQIKHSDWYQVAKSSNFH